MADDARVSGSFRDPSGFIFFRDGVLYRQVNRIYRDDYDLLMSSGLCSSLTSDGLLVEHEETDAAPAQPDIAYRIIVPKHVSFISYPYEWPFSAFKAAALATLEIQQKALELDMTLKDASAYNIQFVDAKPILLDTLSFERYREGKPWVAYRQFCQHFLAPLALMALKDVRLSQLLRVFIDGVPLDLASGMLPRKTRFSFGIGLHIHMHAKSQARHADDASKASQKTALKGKMSKRALLGLIDSLRSLVSKLSWKPADTEWGEYYDGTNYSEDSIKAKYRIVEELLEKSQPLRNVWDLGANTGFFSRIASEKGTPTVAFDIDPAAVEKNYLACVAESERNLLPLVLDLANPSPSLGWHNRERDSLIERGPADAVLALALVHHMAISNNVPLPMVADFLASVCHSLIIEFVPKSDSQVQRLLATREDIFPDYTGSGFETAFKRRFNIEDARPVAGTERTLYLMKRK
jgi:ribosomal protein L11 methylase PrmA